jgi:Ca-activated chloride channel family protein
LLPNPSLAADPPDKLYRQGRYEEAEKAYAKADMDHPKDIRFRYNRGCAAFQNGQYQEADAAFSSVMRRAKDGSVRFRAAYNLGNTAYKQGDYATAATYYKEALTANPDSEDARYNFELALRAIEQGKQKQPDASNADPQRGDKKEEGKEEKNSEKFGQSQNQGSEKKDQNKEDTPKGDSEKRPDDSKTDDTTALDGNQNPGSTRDEKPETVPEADNATTDKKKAEALLDNVQENPAELLRFMFPEENRQRTASGRDW